MKKREWCYMYSKIQELKENNLNVSQIARNLDISRNTVYKYMDMTPEEFYRLIEGGRHKSKKLDIYTEEILEWLKEHPDLSAAQVHDWLQEKHPEKIYVCEKTTRNMVNQLRKEHGIPKAVIKRHYEAIKTPPMGKQMQVDLGQIKLQGIDNKKYTLHLIVFLLSHSRYKYVEWQDRPFKTSDIIRAHENAFNYFEGMPEEVVFDQDRLVLVDENYGDLIYTYEFEAYRKQRNFKVFMCRKKDPESKGRVENTVGYVKYNFARHRKYSNLDKLNEECLSWLERTGNGKEHNTTKKIPAEVFLEEKKHLRPVPNTFLNIVSAKDSISRMVRKDNVILYEGNRYSVPTGTYDGTEKYLNVDIDEEGMLAISDQKTGEIIARHNVSPHRGELIDNNNHKRDRSRNIEKYLSKTTELLGNTGEAREFLEKIRQLKTRYIRDQLQLIEKTVANTKSQVIEDALDYCLKYSLYRATDFRDVVDYYKTIKGESTEPESEESTVILLDENDKANLKAKPETRDTSYYQQAVNEER